MKKSEALRCLVNAAQLVWAYSPMFVCLSVCKGMHMCVCVCVCPCMPLCVQVCVQTGLINAAPPSGVMRVEWLVSTSWTLTLSLLVSGDFPPRLTPLLELQISSCLIKSALSSSVYKQREKSSLAAALRSRMCCCGEKWLQLPHWLAHMFTLVGRIGEVFPCCCTSFAQLPLIAQRAWGGGAAIC